jgi:hypothetical protein
MQAPAFANWAGFASYQIHGICAKYPLNVAVSQISLG